MSIITVADILELNVLKNARIVAGKRGLNREVNSVNVYDNPPSTADLEIGFVENDIYLSFLYFAKEDFSYLDKVYQRLSANHAAALIVFDEYFQELPPEYATLFDEAQIPVIFTDFHTPYSAVITSIIEFRMYAEQRKNLEDKIASLIGKRISQREKMEIVAELNPNFEKNAMVLFAIDRTNPQVPVSSILNLCNAVNQNARAFATEYKGGILVILTYSDSRLSEVAESHQRYIELIHQHLPQAIIGISDLRPLQTLGTVIAQSYTALTSGRAAAGETVYYKNIGISRILIALYDTPALEQFYNDMTQPILQSDADNKGQLFDTLLTFARLNMDYKKTAAAMYVHENTVRYRINKIKELIPYGSSEVDFQDTLSITYKIYLMQNF